jgi:hypothetical protein
VSILSIPKHGLVDKRQLSWDVPRRRRRGNLEAHGKWTWTKIDIWHVFMYIYIIHIILNILYIHMILYMYTICVPLRRNKCICIWISMSMSMYMCIWIWSQIMCVFNRRKHRDFVAKSYKILQVMSIHFLFFFGNCSLLGKVILRFIRVLKIHDMISAFWLVT